MAGEDLGYKPVVFERAKFEYSPLGKIFHRGLVESDKEEGLLKRLENIESKNEQQLKEVEYQGERQLHSKEKKQLNATKKQEEQLNKIKNKKKQLIKKLRRKKN